MRLLSTSFLRRKQNIKNYIKRQFFIQWNNYWLSLDVGIQKLSHGTAGRSHSHKTKPRIIIAVVVRLHSGQTISLCVWIYSLSLWGKLRSLKEEWKYNSSLIAPYLPDSLRREERNFHSLLHPHQHAPSFQSHLTVKDFDIWQQPVKMRENSMNSDTFDRFYQFSSRLPLPDELFFSLCFFAKFQSMNDVYVGVLTSTFAHRFPCDGYSYHVEKVVQKCNLGEKGAKMSRIWMTLKQHCVGCKENACKIVRCL